MKLVILAAGHATRMYPFSDAIPKSLMPVGGKPVIRWIVDRWSPHVDDIVICINDEDFDLFNHEFRDIRKVDFSCSDQPLGTSGEIENAKDLLENKGFILHYGDIITDINVEDFKFYHTMRYLDDYCRREDKYVGTLVLIKERLENSIVKVNRPSNIIYSFDEKPTSDNYCWGAIAAFSHRIFEYIDDGKDFGVDIFPKIISDGKTLGAYISDSKWYNTGDVKNWELADKAAKDGII